MIRCSCGFENRDGIRFCEECGATLDVTCPSCHASVPASRKFCGNCGHALTVRHPAASRFSSPDSYTPKHLAERILTSKTALEGERKQVTVLFADLKGSMELLADRDPEEARKILDPVLELMMEAVHRYEGTVNQVMGDGIMALFGAPLAHEDHAARACYAALRMQETMKRYAEDARRAHGVSVQIRVGLNSGEVVVRAIGSDLHMDYTAVGQTTHLAARMEQLADPGAALLTAATLGLAEDFIHVRSLGPTPVKGVSEPVEIYELAGAIPLRSRFQAHAARGLTKFVGRASEMARLAEALASARDAQGQIVAVVGEPGIGKSRLFWEFVHSHRTDGCVVIEAASVSYGKATTYFPVIDLLRGYFQVEPRDDTRKIREKVTGKLLSLDRASEPSLPALLARLDVPVEDEDWSRLDPPQRRQRTLDAVKRLLLRESQAQPLVVVFEDLHWIDGETQAVLDGFVESLPTSRVLLLVNYRPEYRHAWGSKTYYRQLQIQPLPVASAEELLTALLGHDSGLDPLKQLLIERTQGNPFFLEETVRTLMETKVLAGESGTYRLVRAPESLRIPATAQAILAARIDRLASEDKQLLQAASVIGKDVPLALLEATADMPGDELRRGLGRLQAAEFLYEAMLFPEVEYTFKHALTHEVAYGTLLVDRRRRLHARIVDTIERLHSHRLAEYAERLGHHAVRGELWDKAVLYLRQAGEKALSRHAYREALGFFEEALSALAHLPENRGSTEQAVDLRFSLRNALWPFGEFSRVLDYLREAESLAEMLKDQRRLARLFSLVAQTSFMVGDNDRAVEAGQRALAIAGDTEDLGPQVVARFSLTQAYFSLGDYDRVIHFAKHNVDHLRGDLISERFGLLGSPSVMSRTWLAWSLAERGEFPEAIAWGNEAVRIAESLDQPASLIVACWGIGISWLRKGEFAKSIQSLVAALDLCKLWHLGPLSVWTAGCLGSAYALSGRVDDAIDLLEPAVEQAGSKGRYTLSLLLSWLGEAYLLAGRTNAMEIGERALQVSRDQNERGCQAYSLRLLGEIARRRDPPSPETAESCYRQATTLATDLGMRPLIAHCQIGLAQLYRRFGKSQKADAHFATATTMYREMEMTYWLEKAEREMKEFA